MARAMGDLQELWQVATANDVGLPQLRLTAVAVSWAGHAGHPQSRAWLAAPARERMSLAAHEAHQTAVLAALSGAGTRAGGGSRPDTVVLGGHSLGAWLAVGETDILMTPPSDPY